MQTLYVKSKDAQSTSASQVIRSFMDASGAQIFLHANGVYGDKAGNPVAGKEELKLLPPVHRARAEAWWDRIGHQISAEFRRKIEEREATRAGDFQESIAEMNSELDGILYARRAMVKGKPATAVTAPQAWMEFGFAARPDWWGQAKTVAFKDFTYEMLDPVPVAPAAETETKKAE